VFCNATNNSIRIECAYGSTVLNQHAWIPHLCFDPSPFSTSGGPPCLKRSWCSCFGILAGACQKSQPPRSTVFWIRCVIGEHTQARYNSRLLMNQPFWWPTWILTLASMMFPLRLQAGNPGCNYERGGRSDERASTGFRVLQVSSAKSGPFLDCSCGLGVT